MLRRGSTIFVLLMLTLDIAAAQEPPDTASPPAGAPDSLPTGWRTGGSLGLFTLGGDFNVSPGVGGSGERLYISENGFGFGFLVHGSIHDTDADNVILWTLFGGIEGRRNMSVQDDKAVLFVGVRGGVGLWNADVPNQVTLEFTSVSALGGEFGVTAGFLGVVSSNLDMGITVTYSGMWFGEAGTEAFRFADTDATGRQFTVAVTLYRRDQKVPER